MFCYDKNIECEYANSYGLCSISACCKYIIPTGNVFTDHYVGEKSPFAEYHFSPWHTGTPTEKGDYLCAFEMSDESIEYGWCQWDGKAWDVLCDYDPNLNEMLAYQKFEPYKEKK